MGQFRNELACVLCNRGPTKDAKRGRPSTSSLKEELLSKKRKGSPAPPPPKDIRKDGAEHWPTVAILSHHSSWGSSTNNTYGVSLMELLYAHLCFLNKSSVTQQTSPNEGSSVPDLSICTPNLASTISWSSYGSDHFPLLLRFPFYINFTFRHSPRIKYQLNNADWDTFKSNIEQKMTQLHSESTCAVALTTLFIEVADKTFPLKNGALCFTPFPPYWHQECWDAES
ncbi:unnamed protein product [Pieris brassicae]|uniref:Endonuclease/exonuclease/phosphatase domain-containing protein n=1 Tax=Pieris brassicae TaxID=7116 RepID=A0A9P0TRZ2_PIEBR|nr:unnamed protein product [Pieris brassicae]